MEPLIRLIWGQLFIEHLLHVRYCVRSWDKSRTHIVLCCEGAKNLVRRSLGGEAQRDSGAQRSTSSNLRKWGVREGSANEKYGRRACGREKIASLIWITWAAPYLWSDTLRAAFSFVRDSWKPRWLAHFYETFLSRSHVFPLSSIETVGISGHMAEGVADAGVTAIVHSFPRSLPTCCLPYMLQYL